MFPRIARVLLLALGVLLVAGSVVGAIAGVPLIPPAVAGALIIIGVAFERWRYKPLETAPEAGFEPTGERFLDPTSRKPVRVYANPATGERWYVEDSTP